MLEQYTNPATDNSVALFLVDEGRFDYKFVVVVVNKSNNTYEETKYKAEDFRSAIKQYDEVKKQFKKG